MEKEYMYFFDGEMRVVYHFMIYNGAEPISISREALISAGTNDNDKQVI